MGLQAGAVSGQVVPGDVLAGMGMESSTPEAAFPLESAQQGQELHTEWGSQIAKTLPKLGFTALNIFPGQDRFSGRAGSILPLLWHPRSHIPAPLPSCLENTWEPFCSGRNSLVAVPGAGSLSEVSFHPFVGLFLCPCCSHLGVSLG